MRLIKSAAFSALLLMVFISPTVGFTDESSKESHSRYYFTGLIGKDSSIQMELIFESGDISGWYYYDKRGIPLLLSGTLSSKDSTIKLDEKSDKGLMSGSFSGKTVSVGTERAKTIEGQWKNASGEVSLPFKITKVADFVHTDDAEGEKIEASLLYPKFVSNDQAIGIINGELSNSMKAEQAKFLKEAKEFFSSEESAGGWQESRSYSIAYYSKELISLVGEVYSYTGGAHGNTYYLSSNYSITENGASKIKLSDLFNSGSNYLKVLSDYCINDLLLQEAGWVTSGEIKSFTEKELGVFAISPEGIKFAFAPYAVGSYAEGSYFVTVPLSKLKGIYNPEGPLAHLMNQDSK